MIQAIDSKYCKNNLVQLMPYTDVCQLIVSTDEIILLKIGDKVLVNKYTNHPSRELFPFHEKEQNDNNHFTEIYEYNKIYLNYRCSSSGFRFRQEYFFKGSDRALYLDDSLTVDDRNVVETTVELNREEIENIFDSNNYNAMYVFDGIGSITFVSNKNDKILRGKKVIPTDEEIIERELEHRIGDYQMARVFNPNFDANEKYQEYHTPKTIDEIKDFKLYGPLLMGNFADMVLTVKDGKFDLKWFRVDFIEKDRFRLTTSPIIIKIPTIDDVLKYSNKYEINYTPEPYQPHKAISKVHTEENQSLADEKVIQSIDNQEQSVDEQKQEEKGFQKKINKIFKKNNQ